VTLGDLIAVLATVGVPVLPPGTATAGLPAIVLHPGDNEIATGGRRMLRRYDVAVLVPRGGQVEQLAELERLSDAAVIALMPTPAELDGPSRFAASDPTDPVEAPYFARLIPLAFIDTGVDLCPS